MLAPNTTLQGRYRIVRQLGQGGMGTVYEAKALRLNTTVALKETHFTDERLRRQFEREAQLLANLRHPALPRVIDHFDETDGLYLVMDFVEGDDLWEMLKKRGAPFPLADVISWAGQLLDALGYLHAQTPPVIHRDIKPQNLKLTDDGRLILLDFGLAKGMSEGAPSIMSSRTVMGFSLPYAPLEQILQIDENSREQISVLNPQEVERIRRTGTGRRSDIYSVGATLLHLLTAKVPNTSPTRAISIWSNRADPLDDTLAQGVPESLRPFIRRSMTLDPDLRFASAAEMREALRDATESAEGGTVLMPTVLDSASELKTRPLKDSQHGETTRVSPARASHPEHESRKGVGRRRVMLGFIVAFIAAFVAAAVYLNLPDNRTPDGNTNPPAQPSTPPTVTPAPQPSVSPTQEVSEQPVNSARNANVRTAPATTPTPRPVTPTPQPTPTPQANENKAVEPGGDAGGGTEKIDEEISRLENRRAALLLTHPPGSPAVRRMDRMIANLKRRRALKLLNR
jgi:serine/threonine protein kinase